MQYLSGCIMSSSDKTLNALSNLVVNCPELTEVESLLGRFNLFRVLKFEDEWEFEVLEDADFLKNYN